MRKLPIVVGVLVVLGAIYLIAEPGDPSQEASSFEPSFPPGGPAEFLYLDANRVATYLAQVEGGEVESEKLTRKLTQDVSAKVAPSGLTGVEATKARELFAERTVKPTAASSFFALRTRLEDAGVISEIRPRFFEEDVEPLREGTFVEFKTSALLSPIYINAYLAVLHAGTLAAIFPDSPSKQEEAKDFFNKVGPTGRAVFALQPYAQLPDQASSPGSLGRKPFEYLLPITAPLLTSERSLLKFGGGSYTVLGKLVRRFPESTSARYPAYVDSATNETWERALELAPGELLCRTTPGCAEAIRSGKLDGAERSEKIDDTRQQILTTLKEQTTIPSRGAVILPIGIYK